MITTKKITQKRFCNICGTTFKTSKNERFKCNKCSKYYCISCGNEIDEWRANKSFCSNECEKKNKILIKTMRKCSRCKKEIQPTEKFVYDKTDEEHRHILCEINNIKQVISEYESYIKSSVEEIEYNKKEIIQANIKLQKLAKKYPEEVVKTQL